MRKLASIQRILELHPIPNADAIERATVLGWQLVVKRGEFAVGDLCVYCEIDSVLPERPEFEFLRARAMRIRTVRLRGQISQGICFPLAILPEGTAIEEGADVTELLGIVKHDPPLPANLAGVAKGQFPSFVPKTDETRVQVLQPQLDKYAGQTFFVTEKLDGTSVTFYLKDGVFGACSRNLDLVETPDNSIWAYARANGMEEKLAAVGRNIALQGEMIGEGVQGNLYKLRGQHVFFFNAFDIDAYRYLDFAEFNALLESLGLRGVPVLETDFTLVNDIPALVAKAGGHSVLHPVEREGIVLRPLNEIRDPEMGRVSFKAISPEFLLKHE